MHRQHTGEDYFNGYIALGPVPRFMTRNLYALLDSRYAWCDVLKVSPQAHMELEFWINCLHSQLQYTTNMA